MSASNGDGYILADVFTDRPFTGNPLAVFPAAAEIPPGLMPRIARELNLSETVFVLPPDAPEHTAKLRILTPDSELPFAGHPTLGAACVLLSLGTAGFDGDEGTVVFEEGVGPVPVHVRREGGGFRARLSVPGAPEFGPEPPDRDTLARLLSIPPDAIGDGDLAPMAVSWGVPYLFIPVRDRRTLGRVRVNTAVWEDAVAGFWAPHLYVITRDVEHAGSGIRARMSAPAMGIAEDPATGAAAAALAAYLWRHAPAPGGPLAFRIEQGFEMGRPSLIDVEGEVATGVLAGVRVGGSCVIVGSGEMRVRP